jgi:hypothetical protein
MSTDPFATKSSGETGSSTNIGDHEGELLLIWPREVKMILTKHYGEKEAVRADWVVLTGDSSGELEEDALIFGGFMIGDLKKLAKKNYKVDDDEGDAERHLLRPFLARIAQGKEKIKGNHPWLFEDASDADKVLAVKWLEENKPQEANPFDS